MLSRKTMALNVNNLSDARYFAAYDVDIMSYMLGKEGDNIATIKEIIEWVEGPENYIQLEEWSAELARFGLAETGALGLVVDERHETEARMITEDVIVITENMEKGKALGMNSVVVLPCEKIALIERDTAFYILPLNMTLEDIEACINNSPDHGFVFVGGDEERAGFKSFEDLDEYIELLLE